MGSFGGGLYALRPLHINAVRVNLGRLYISVAVAVATAGLVAVAGCDTSISGTPLDNQPPTTQLSVRDTSLVGNISEQDRLASTVFVSWTGNDPDGYIVSFDLRYYDEHRAPGDEEGWINTTRNDTLILLPIPRGEAVANVVFEVRAVDNDGLRDPRPARTVFPIKNSPPTLRLLQADFPPDTTFPVASFGWDANDPEGEETIDRIEVSLNDSLNFISLPAETRFITLVARPDYNDPAQNEMDARVYLGRSFQTTEITLPGLLLDGENTLYARSVDQTDTTSALQRFTWYVRKPVSEILFVNDFRRAAAPTVQAFHLGLLREYLGGADVSVWDLSTPYATGSTVVPTRSENLPRLGDPTLRQTLGLFRYIYWVTSASTNSAQGNNLPFSAATMDVFFNNGGKLMVHSPVTRPQNPEDNLGNPAVLLLPISDLVALPDSVRRLELPRNAGVTPVASLPGVSEPLPELHSNAYLISELPYFASGSNTLPLYEADYQYFTTTNRRGPWANPRTVASMSADRRIALFALPMINENSGAPALVGADGDPEAARRAVWLMLESLEFPR